MLRDRKNRRINWRGDVGHIRQIVKPASRSTLRPSSDPPMDGEGCLQAVCLQEQGVGVKAVWLLQFVK